MRKNLLALSVFIILFIALCNAYHGQTLNRLPHGPHEWGQADRLALAMKFYDNGMNFFKPATYNRNSIDGIVGVEFPLPSYLAATAGHIFGRENINISFRLLTLLFACAGLSFLFATCFKATRNVITSLIPPIIIFSSPAFVDYAASYLSDPTGISVAFIAFYSMYAYIETGIKKHFYTTIILLTLAALIKTTIGLYLLGFAGLWVLLQVRKSKNIFSRENSVMMFAILISFAVLFGYNRYVNYVNLRYNATLFFATIAPFENMEELQKFLRDGFRFHLISYFAMTSYILLFLIITPGVVLLLRTAKGKLHVLLSTVFLIGVICVSGLLGKQLTAHEYYLMSIIFPLIGYLLVISMITITNSVESAPGRRALQASALVTCLFTIFFTDFYLAKRRSPEYDLYPRSFWMEGGARAMEKAGIGKNELILALNEEAPNLTLVYMDRSGYILPWFAWNREHAGEIEQFMRQRKVRYFVCETGTIKHLVSVHPDIFKNFRLILEEGQITVMALKS